MINSRGIISPPRSTTGKQPPSSGAGLARVRDIRGSEPCSDSFQQQLSVPRATAAAARAMAQQSRLERELDACRRRLEATESRLQDDPRVVDERAVATQRLAIRTLEQQRQQVAKSVQQLRARLRAMWQEELTA